MQLFYNFTKDFREKNMLHPDFQTELSFKLDEVLIELVGEEKYYKDSSIYNYINNLRPLLIEIYKGGIEAGRGMSYQEIADRCEEDSLSKEAMIDQLLKQLNGRY